MNRTARLSAIIRLTRQAILLAALVLVLLPVACVHAQDDPGASVVGTVTNGTAGGSVPAGQPVILRFFSLSEWTDTLTTTISADGTFRFTDLEQRVGQDFVTSIDHEGVTTYSEPEKVQADTEVVTDLMIYETTEDVSVIQVNQVHYFIVPKDGTARIAEFYLIGNVSDRAFIGSLDPSTGMRSTIAFSPPAGATNLTFESAGIGERFIGDATRFADSQPILPGTATLEVNFSYDLPYEPGQIIERVTDLPIASIAVLVSSETVGVEGMGLNPGGFMNTQMGAAASYSGGPLAAGEPFTFAFVPQTMPVPTPTPTTQPAAARDSGSGLAVGIAALAAGAVAIYWLWLRPKRERSAAPIPVEARALVEEIVSLDGALLAGEIEASEHERRVEELRKQLAAYANQPLTADEPSEPESV